MNNFSLRKINNISMYKVVVSGEVIGTIEKIQRMKMKFWKISGDNNKYYSTREIAANELYVRYCKQL